MALIFLGILVVFTVSSFEFQQVRSPWLHRRPSVCLSSVTLVHPTQPIDILGSVSTPFNTLATWRHPGKILRRLSQGNPSVVRIKHKRGSQI